MQLMELHLLVSVTLSLNAQWIAWATGQLGVTALEPAAHLCTMKGSLSWYAPQSMAVMLACMMTPALITANVTRCPRTATIVVLVLGLHGRTVRHHAVLDTRHVTSSQHHASLRQRLTMARAATERKPFLATSIAARWIAKALGANGVHAMPRAVDSEHRFVFSRRKHLLLSGATTRAWTERARVVLVALARAQAAMVTGVSGVLAAPLVVPAPCHASFRRIPRTAILMALCSRSSAIPAFFVTTQPLLQSSRRLHLKNPRIVKVAGVYGAHATERVALTSALGTKRT